MANHEQTLAQRLAKEYARDYQVGWKGEPFEVQIKAFGDVQEKAPEVGKQSGIRFGIRSEMSDKDLPVFRP